MNIYITLDYEIYFGKNHGTVERCIIEPTNELIRIANKHNIKFVFFIDCGFILKLDEYRKKFPVLEKDYAAICKQVTALSQQGHDIQLHIHPHWEDSYFDGQRWIINVKRYKISDFSAPEISSVFSRYVGLIKDLTGIAPIAFRAGGWCIQPFDAIKNELKKHSITTDSTVFSGGHYVSENYFYDFRNSPYKTSWRFEDDPLKENNSGYFKEIAISAHTVSPLFYWQLFLMGRLDPHHHKPLGDGSPMPAPGQRKKLLTSFTRQTVSIDGYNAKLLQSALNNLIKTKRGNEMVVIGHPKSLTCYAASKLDEFIGDNIKKHTFGTFR